jgi:hypothetical protein
MGKKYKIKEIERILDVLESKTITKDELNAILDKVDEGKELTIEEDIIILREVEGVKRRNRILFSLNIVGALESNINDIDNAIAVSIY